MNGTGSFHVCCTIKGVVVNVLREDETAHVPNVERATSVPNVMGKCTLQRSH